MLTVLESVRMFVFYRTVILQVNGLTSKTLLPVNPFTCLPVNPLTHHLKPSIELLIITASTMAVMMA